MLQKCQIYHYFYLHMINTKSKYKNIINDIQIIFYLYFRFYKMSNYFYHNFFLYVLSK